MRLHDRLDLFADTEGRLGRTSLPTRWSAFPTDYVTDPKLGGIIVQRSDLRPIERQPTRGMFRDFLRLADEDSKDEAIAAFASKFAFANMAIRFQRAKAALGGVERQTGACT
jgi:hypothetical protein